MYSVCTRIYQLILIPVFNFNAIVLHQEHKMKSVQNLTATASAADLNSLNSEALQNLKPGFESKFVTYILWVVRP